MAWGQERRWECAHVKQTWLEPCSFSLSQQREYSLHCCNFSSTIEFRRGINIDLDTGKNECGRFNFVFLGWTLLMSCGTFRLVRYFTHIVASICQCAVEIYSYAEGIFDVLKKHSEMISLILLFLFFKIFFAGVADMTLFVTLTATDFRCLLSRKPTTLTSRQNMSSL